MFRKTASLLAAALLLCTTGCGTQAEGSAPKAVNALCPIRFEPVEDDGGRTEWNGKTVGFCCKNCIADFEALDEAAKTAALEKAGSAEGAGG